MDGGHDGKQHNFTPLQVGNPSPAGFNINVKLLTVSNHAGARERIRILPLTRTTQTQSNQDGASIRETISSKPSKVLSDLVTDHFYPKKILRTLVLPSTSTTQTRSKQDGASICEPKVPTINRSCCVPRCTFSTRRQPHLAFHDFPDDFETRKKWVCAIKQDKVKAFCIKQGLTYVCEEHFQPEDYEPYPTGGTKCLKPGVIPSCFQYPPPAVYSVASEHNYCKDSNDIKLTVLRMQHDKLVGECKKLEEAALTERYSVLKFAESDDAIQFYTRFPTYNHFMAFWQFLEPAASRMEYCHSKAKRNRKVLAAPDGLSALTHTDEFFLFMARLVQGLELLDLAQLFKVEYACANLITRSWANFLYTFLASVPIWISKESIQAHLPVEFQHFPDTRVVIDFMEFRCRTPLSHWEEKEDELLYAEHECDSTLKAMVGMAPHGLVTFVSTIFPGSLSDEEVFRRSGIIPLLTPNMAIMVDESLDVGSLVPCKIHQLPFLSKEKEIVVYKMKRSTKLLRLYVDQMFLRVRNYEFFKSIIPLSTANSLNQMFTVACKLVNYQ